MSQSYHNFRKGQWVRYLGGTVGLPIGTLKEPVGEVQYRERGLIYVRFLGEQYTYGAYPVHLKRLHKTERAMAIAKKALRIPYDPTPVTKET